MEVGDPVLVGRQTELEQVAEALADEVCRGVALRGAAGVGKTRLAEECLRIAGDLGFVTRRVLATPSSTDVPLGAMAGLIPPLGEDANPLGAAKAALRAAGGSGRLLLLVDDAQWLDDTSASLVLQVVADGDAFAVLTIRSGEAIPAALAIMLRSHRFRQIDVGPLSDREIAALVEAQLGDAVDPSVCGRVVELSDGFPLAAHEIVLGAVESAAVKRRDGRWTAVAAIERSSRVVDLVEDRLARLDERHRRALGLVALADPLPAAWVPKDDLATLAELESAGLVTVRDLGSAQEIRVAHPLYGEVLRGTMSPLARRANLGEILAQAGDRTVDEHDRLRLIVWSLELGVEVPSDELGRAARRAFATHRIDLAARFLATIPDQERTADERYELMCAWYWTGRNKEADRLLEQMMTDPADDRELARAAETEALNDQYAGRFDAAREVVARALDRVRNPDEALRLRVSQFANSIGEMSPPEVVEVLLPLADTVPDDALVSLGFVLALALNVTGRPERAVEVAERTAVVHRRIWTEDPVAGFPKHPANTLVSLAFALACAGRLVEAENVVEEIRVYEDRTSSIIVQGHAESSAAFNALLAGRPLEAADRYTVAARLFDRTVNRHGARSLLSWALGTMACAQAGEAERARSAATRLDDARPNPMFDPVTPLALGWSALADHRDREAVDHLVLAVESAARSGALLFGVLAAWSLVRAGAADRVPAGVAAWRPEVDGELLPAWLDGVEAARSGDPEGLEAVAGRLSSCGCPGDAAEALGAAARLWIQLGEPRRATAAARRVRDLVAGCPEVRTPGLVVPVEPAPLTRREREVAALAADGIPAKVIAERLYISERTVTNHLQRVYEKLGVSSRAELREAMGRG